MNFYIGVISEADNFDLNIKYLDTIYTSREANIAKKYYDSLNEKDKKWFERLSFDSMMWWSRAFVDGIKKTPKELKKERGDLMRAKREAKRAAQIRS
jgi:hypothetical protein